MFTTILILFFVFILLGLFCVLHVFLAKSRAIRRRQSEAEIFGGLVKLILWESNEGLVLLKNKQVDMLVYGPTDGGGTRFIYPILGEELKVRVPLAWTLTHFTDGKVLTRESTQLFFKVGFWWRVAELEKYYLSINREVHHHGDVYSHDGVPEVFPYDGPSNSNSAGEKWLLALAESCIRKLVSQTTTAMIVSKAASRYLHVDQKHQSSNTNAPVNLLPPVRRNATGDAVKSVADAESLGGQIHDLLRSKVAEYGLEVDRVEILEVRLPSEIQAAIDEVFKATLKPARTEQEAIAEQIRLRSLAEVLGVETVRMTEAMKSLQGTQFIGVPNFLQELLGTMSKQMNALPASPGGSQHVQQTLPSAKPLARVTPVMCPRCGGETKSDDNPERPYCPTCKAAFRVKKPTKQHSRNEEYE